MNKEQLQKDIDELKAKLASMEAELNKEEIKIFPRKGERYYFAYPWGKIGTEVAEDSNGRINVYKTEEEAEKARDIGLAKARVKHAIEVANNGWKVDWTISQFKYEIYLNEYKLEARYPYHMKTQPDWMYCATPRIANDIIKEYENDLLLIFSE